MHRTRVADALTAVRLWAVLRRVWLATVIGLGVACSAAPPPDPTPRVSQFQQDLDRLDVAYTVPATGKAILVNIPAYELIAFADGMPVFRSPIIVGTPENPTPLLTTATRTVRFRPTWRPTATMIASGEYRDRVWPPGRENPLGLAAVRLRTSMPIYLHDTNNRNLFGQSMRALSHGCIRVQRWEQLVSWTLDMPMSEVLDHASGSQTLDFATPDIPVRFGYFLAFPNDAGDRMIYPDIYGYRTVAATRRADHPNNLP